MNFLLNYKQNISLEHAQNDLAYNTLQLYLEQDWQTYIKRINFHHTKTKSMPANL